MVCRVWQYDGTELQQQSQQHYGLASMYDPRSAHHSPSYPPSVGACGAAAGPMSYGPPPPPPSAGYPGSAAAGLVGGGSSPDGQLKRDKDAIYG